MSRTQAAGKVKREHCVACGVPRLRPWRDPGKATTGDERCAQTIPTRKVHKLCIEELVRAGRVDWDAVHAGLREQGIVLIGGGADEAPEVYKRLPDVLDAHAGSIRVKHTLRPARRGDGRTRRLRPYKD